MKSKKTILITGISFVSIFLLGLILSFLISNINNTSNKFDTYISTNIGTIQDCGNYYLAEKKNVSSNHESMSNSCTQIRDRIVDCFTEYPLNFNPNEPHSEYPSLGDGINGYDACYCGFSGMNNYFLVICKRISANKYSYTVLYSELTNVYEYDFINSVECINIINNL